MNEIAVIITCFNDGRTLHDTLDAVFAQTRPASDIVIVDDGSTKLSTRHVLARLARPFTRVVQTDHRGLAAARNHGVRLVSAPYIFPLTARDLLDPTYFDKAGARLDADPHLGFVSCAVQAFEGASYAWMPPASTMVNLLTRGGAHAETLMRRTLWEVVGGFDETLSTGSVRDFWATALERGFRGEVLPEPLVRRRIGREARPETHCDREANRTSAKVFLEKHRRSADQHACELVVAHDSYLVELRQHRAELERARLDLPEAPKVPPDWGELRRLSPMSRRVDIERGLPVDRHYVERFIAVNRGDVGGRVLEVKESRYAGWFGGAQVEKCDVIDIDATNPEATPMPDLCHTGTIPSDTYDAIVLPQALHLVYDVRAALSECLRILKPGGVLLTTLPSAAPIDCELGLDHDFWRFTEGSARRLFADLLPLESFDVTAYGNVMTCAAFLYGLSADELLPSEIGRASCRERVCQYV